MQTITGPPPEEPINALKVLMAQVAALEKKLNENEKETTNTTNDNGEPSKKKKRKPRKKWVQPKELDGKPQPKDIDKPVEVNGTKYWYCLVHGWCLHPFNNLEDVKGCFNNFANKSPDTESNNNTQQSKDDKQSDRRGRVVKAYNAIIAKPKV